MNCFQHRVSVERTECTERTTSGVVNNRNAVLDPVSWVQAEVTPDECARIRLRGEFIEAQLYSFAARHLETLISATGQAEVADIHHSGSVHRHIVVFGELGSTRAWVHLLETRQLCNNNNSNIRTGQREVVCGRFVVPQKGVHCFETKWRPATYQQQHNQLMSSHAMTAGAQTPYKLGFELRRFCFQT